MGDLFYKHRIHFTDFIPRCRIEKTVSLPYPGNLQFFFSILKRDGFPLIPPRFLSAASRLSVLFSHRKRSHGKLLYF